MTIGSRDADVAPRQGSGRSGIDRATLPALASVGAALMAAGSWWIGAVPVGWQVGHAAKVVATFGFYLGLAVLCAAWLALGRLVLKGADAPVRRFVVCGALPFLAAAPAGRDLWAYAAQGRLLIAGLNPYDHGPSDAPGRFAGEVSARWADSPSPYGPIWLRLSQLVTWACHGHPLAAVLLLRLPAFAGLLLCCWALPRLSRRLDGKLDQALWLGAASPLMLVLGLGGGHNDLLMLGLALAGLSLAASPGARSLAAAGAVVGVAVLVKSPAAVVLAFTVAIQLHVSGAPRTPRTVLTTCGYAALPAAVVVVGGTAACRLGTGWTHEVSTHAHWLSWLSFPSAVAMAAKALTGTSGVRDVDHLLIVCRTVGEVCALVLMALLWLMAMRRVRPRAGYPAGYLAGALGCAAAFGPAVQPWYYLWALVVVGLVALSRRALTVLAATGLMFAVMVTPSGKGWESDWRAVPVVVLALAVCATLVGGGPRPQRRSGV